MLPCVSIAPLATPVVPPVYCRNAMILVRKRHGLHPHLGSCLEGVP